MRRGGATCLLMLAMAIVSTTGRAQPVPDEAQAPREQAGVRDHGERGDRHRRGSDESLPVPSGVRVPTWSELTADQQTKLAALEKQWDTLPASRRVRALEHMERRDRWEAMSPEQREHLREGARNFRDMPPELREKMRTSMQTLRGLPEDERKELFRRWRSLDPEQRRIWLEAGGPGLSPPPGETPTTR